ncbi:hypothetical protein ACQP1P_19240 [Dactylosporangium sp. CA-052675]|uniref:hypothetical protein n=1 Tax=Dactylosporangium sp. CA-052675 TaxID=3239927 RepID=UPI003D9451EA
MTTVMIGGPVCRRCVRRISARVRDLPGVVSLELCGYCGRLRVRGGAGRAALLAAVSEP